MTFRSTAFQTGHIRPRPMKNDETLNKAALPMPTQKGVTSIPARSHEQPQNSIPKCIEKGGKRPIVTPTAEPAKKRKTEEDKRPTPVSSTIRRPQAASIFMPRR